MDNRRYDIDNFKGFLIFLVVFGHLLLPVSLKNSGYCYEVFSFIYFFHMPAFLFLSGLLTKKNESNFSNKIIKYIFLYFLFNFSFAIIDNFLNGTEISLTIPYYSMWFLLCLIVYKLLIHFCDNFLLLPFSIILSVCSGFCNLDNTFAISRIVAFLPFFLIGYFCNKCNLLEKKDRIYQKSLPLNLLLSFCSTLFIIIFTLKTDFPLDFYTIRPFESQTEIIYRILFIFVNILFFVSIFLIIPNKKMLYFTNIGKNSLNIYLLHRFITLFLEKVFIEDKIRLIISLFLSIIICFVLSSKKFNLIFNKFIDILFKKQVYVYFFLSLFLFTYNLNLTTDKTFNQPEKVDIDNCIKISYVGDFILFENDIYNSEENNSYNFDDYFKYTKDLLGDYTFGVLEGPVSNNYYSTGNYNDNKKVSLNYPVEFLEEISKNIDFVTIGTNHLLDRGKNGLVQTINNLNNFKLDYTGAYLSKEEKEDIKIINIEGIKFAVLSYTYGVNNSDELETYMYNSFDEKNIKEQVKKAKLLGADKIIVMSHIGTQFSHEIDYNQLYFNQFFASLGVDIVFSDHAHCTQPITYIDNTIIFNCPGNYVSSFTEFDGGYSAICNLYINRDTLEIVTSSFVPLSAVKNKDSLTIPISCYDLNDITGFNIVSKSMINKTFDYVIPEVFYNKNVYVTINSSKINFSNSEIKEYIGNDSICFIGDSLTEGTKNDGHPWYESLDLGENKVYNISKGGATSETIKDLLLENPYSKDFDCYIIAIGTNDIRYNNLPANNYIENIEEIVSILGADKKYIFLDPWYFLNSDCISIINIDNKDDILNSYSYVLSDFCDKNNYLYINTIDYLRQFFDKNKSSLYLIDYIHPNIKGVEIYSEAFLKSKNNFNTIKN